MSSLSLSSIFSYKSTSSSKSGNQNILKRSTMTFMSKTSSNNTQQERQQNRYSTLSKVGKRFSSILIKHKNEAHKKVDNIFPSPPFSESTLSLASLDSESDEEIIITPTSSTPAMPKSPKETVPSITTSQKKNSLFSAVPIEIISSKLEIPVIIEPSSKYEIPIENVHSEKVEITDNTLLKCEIEKPVQKSIVSMIQSQLQLAFEEADREIEQELEESRNKMIKAIYARPQFVYY